MASVYNTVRGRDHHSKKTRGGRPPNQITHRLTGPLIQIEGQLRIDGDIMMKSLPPSENPPLSQMFTLRSERGDSLISVMIATVIMGIIAVGFASMHSFSMRATKSVEYKDELISLRRVLRAKTDCSETLTGQICDGITTFPLKDSTGSVIGTPHFGAWKLGSFDTSATCLSGKMSIRFARLKGTNSFTTDPLNKAPFSWEPLYKNGDLDCDDFWSNDTTCDTGCDTPFRDINEGNYRIAAGDAHPGDACNGGAWGWGMHYSATVHCPPGWGAVGGGAACGSFNGGGLAGGTFVLANGSGWFSDCCSYPAPGCSQPDPHSPKVTCNPAASVIKGGAFVVCIKK